VVERRSLKASVTDTYYEVVGTPVLEAFRETLAANRRADGPPAPRSPNLNAYAERFVRTIKESCLNRRIPFGERSLHPVIGEFVEHYHRERNHHGVGNHLLFPTPAKIQGHEPIACRLRLGGPLKYYHRPAA
jgi:putative transposase